MLRVYGEALDRLCVRLNIYLVNFIVINVYKRMSVASVQDGPIFQSVDVID